MDVKTFRRVRKHPRSRPLLRPQADPRENPFIMPNKFPKTPTMTLRINFSREDFHARNPGLFDLGLAFVGGHQLARVQSALRQFLRARCGAIIASAEGALGAGID